MLVKVLVGLEIPEKDEIVRLQGEGRVVEALLHVAREGARFQVRVEPLLKSFEDAVPVGRALVFVPFVGGDDEALLVLDGVGQGRVQLKELVPQPGLQEHGEHLLFCRTNFK